MQHIGVDVGGTFTDLVLVGDGGRTAVHKLPSTPDDPARAIVRGIGELCDLAGISSSEVTLVVHGTTVATGTLILERSR